jgi:hypothetical protein
LFRLFRYWVETPKKTEIVCFGFTKQTETNPKQVLFRFVSVRTDFFLFCFEYTLPGAAGRFSAISWRPFGGLWPAGAARWDGADVCSASSHGGGDVVVWLEKGTAVGMARGGRGVRHDEHTGRRDHQREGVDRKEKCLHSSVLKGERDVIVSLSKVTFFLISGKPFVFQ